MVLAISRFTRPAGTVPGHQAIPGTRMPPSQVIPLPSAQQARGAAVGVEGEPGPVVAGEEDQRPFRQPQVAAASPGRGPTLQSISFTVSP